MWSPTDLHIPISSWPDQYANRQLRFFLASRGGQFRNKLNLSDALIIMHEFGTEYRVRIRILVSVLHPKCSTFSPTRYPDVAPGYIYHLAPPPFKLFFLSFLHTYLVGGSAIKKAVLCYLNSALHNAEAQVVKLSSGTLLAQFLMVIYLIQSFHQHASWLYAVGWRRVFAKVSDYIIRIQD